MQKFLRLPVRQRPFLVKIIGSKTATIKNKIFTFMQVFFLKFYLNFYDTAKAASKDKSSNFAFIFVLDFLMMIGHIKSINATPSA